MVVLEGDHRGHQLHGSLDFFTSFSVSVFKASKTLKFIAVTHFQTFFMWPWAPKKEPKGQPNVICCVSFFDLGPNEVQGGSRRCPREPKRGPGNSKGIQGMPRGTQKGSRGTQKESRGSPGGPKRDPGDAPGGHGGGKAAGNWIIRKSAAPRLRGSRAC